MNPVAQVFKSVREKGIWRTGLNIVAHLRDLAFDYRYGTTTFHWEELENLSVVGSNRVHGEHYQPTKAGALRELLKAIRLPATGAFVDLGCGKGRVLILAAEYGFKRVIGVEFSQALCDAAESNLALYRSRASMVFDSEVVHADVADYEFGAEVRTVFFFNPFDKQIMEKVVLRLQALQHRIPDSLCVIYNNPVHRSLFEKCPEFRLLAEYNIAESEFCVYAGNPLDS